MKFKSSERDTGQSLLGAEVQLHRQDYGAILHNTGSKTEPDDKVKSASMLSLLRRFILQGNIMEFTLQKLLLVHWRKVIVF